MSYYIDDTRFSLKEVEQKIKNSDLIPSREVLLNDIENVFKQLSKQEIKTLADLRKQLKTKKSINSFVIKSGLSEEYLILLRREIESYFPKTYNIDEFFWLPKEELAKLKSGGLTNTKIIYEALDEKKNFKKISAELGISVSLLNSILSLADLTRIQWTSPLTARMLFEAGYTSTKKVASADAEKLFNAVDTLNKREKYYKGTIVQRDIKRLINSASYLEVETR